MIPQEDIIAAFGSAYDEIYDFETFPINKYEAYIIKTSYYEFTLFIKEDEAHPIEIAFSFKDDNKIMIKLLRRSFIISNNLNILLLRKVSTVINEEDMYYDNIREKILSLLVKIVNMQKDESSEIIKSISSRILNLYDKGLINKKLIGLVKKEYIIGVVTVNESDNLTEEKDYSIMFWTRDGLKIEKIQEGIINRIKKEVSPESLKEYEKAYDY